MASASRLSLRLYGTPATGALLAVEDTKPGVPQADLPRLAQRFYRGEHSRTTPGNGLGLSLVAAVADLHGAALLLESGAPGPRVTLRFPAAEHRAANRAFLAMKEHET